MSHARRHLRSGRGLGLIGLILGALLLTACGGGNDTGSESSEGTSSSETGAAASETGSAGGNEVAASCDAVNIGLIPWDEDIALTNLWQYILEQKGYTVKQTQPDVGPLYAALANGQVDVFFDAWLPATHSDYWEQYGDKIDDLGVWFDKAPLTWVVPSYVDDVNSIADLKGKADEFGGKIIGIEPGSGLMRISRTKVMPEYGLKDEYDLVEGSTAAMLAELGNAIEAKEPIVVTLWKPHFAYGKWDLKDLKDPKGALGEPDSIHTLARQGFKDDCPQVAKWFSNFTMSNENLASLEVAINEAGEGKEMEGVKQWVSDNQDLVDQLTS